MTNEIKDLMAVFTGKYEPATTDNYSDTFSSKQIAALINGHLGDAPSLSEIHETLTNMGYEYEMVSDGFVWKVKKV